MGGGEGREFEETLCFIFLFFKFKNENDNYVPFTIIFSINRVRFWIKKCDLSHQDIEKCFWVKH